MLFVRLVLDDVDAAKGGMEMALGSHHLGRVAADQADAGAQGCAREVEQAQRGDVLVMHMLMVHRSTTSSCSTARRVIRADFANAPLPAQLEWLV